MKSIISHFITPYVLMATISHVVGRVFRVINILMKDVKIVGKLQFVVQPIVIDSDVYISTKVSKNIIQEVQIKNVLDCISQNRKQNRL